MSDIKREADLWRLKISELIVRHTASFSGILPDFEDQQRLNFALINVAETVIDEMFNDALRWRWVKENVYRGSSDHDTFFTINDEAFRTLPRYHFHEGEMPQTSVDAALEINQQRGLGAATDSINAAPQESSRKKT